LFAEERERERANRLTNGKFVFYATFRSVELVVGEEELFRRAMEAVLHALQIRTMQTRTMPTPKKDQASGITLTPPQLLANPAHWPSLAEAKIIKAPVVPSKAKPGRRPSATAEPATTTTDSESQSPPFVVADFTLAAVGTSNASAANDKVRSKLC
jgi:hypothetical protein